ncbi:MAG TPA: hypothetical protein GX521_05950, partial [Firmicutes bacterium]|nr:hypothetical protein [Bacillota bacterium]
LVVTDRGFGKRTPLEEYRAINRAGKGVLTLNRTNTYDRAGAFRPI